VPNLEGLKVRPLRPEDRDAWLRAFEAAFGSPFGGSDSIPHFGWLYLRNGSPHLWGAVAVPDGPTEGEIAASYSMIPRRFWVDGIEKLAALSLDTMTGPAWRKRGLFVHLAQETYARAGEQGCAFVYGFPNPNSAPGFWKHLGWRPLPRPEVLVASYPIAWAKGRFAGPGPSEKEAGGVRLKVVDSIDERFDDLWQRARRRLRVSAVRDRAFAEWRWSRPQSCYELSVAEGENGSLLAICVTAVAGRPEGPRAFVVDFLATEGEDRILARLIRFAAARRARADGALLVQAAVSPDSPFRSAFSRFRVLPDRLATPIVPGAASFAAGDSLPATGWHLTYADTDTL